MHHAVEDDRRWFHRHPEAIVRFRESAKGEFNPLTQHGETPPVFRPNCSREGAPLHWVAVVDLMQLLGISSAVPNDEGVRLRVQTPVITRAEHQRAAKKELMEAVAAELLVQTNCTDTGEQQKPENQTLAMQHQMSCPHKAFDIRKMHRYNRPLQRIPRCLPISGCG